MDFGADFKSKRRRRARQGPGESRFGIKRPEKGGISHCFQQDSRQQMAELSLHLSFPISEIWLWQQPERVDHHRLGSRITNHASSHKSKSRARHHLYTFVIVLYHLITSHFPVAMSFLTGAIRTAAASTSARAVLLGRAAPVAVAQQGKCFACFRLFRRHRGLHPTLAARRILNCIRVESNSQQQRQKQNYQQTWK